MDMNKFNDIFKNSVIAGDKIIVDDAANSIKLVKDNYGFDMLKEIIAVDNEEKGIELIYNLYSTVNEENLKLSITVKDEAVSVSNIFDSAVADEKEIYDLFGVNFAGNPELKRLYMPQNWLGHPLRKDYELQDGRLRWNE